jgi:hypothetical protein
MILGNIYGILTVRAANTIMLLHTIMAQSLMSRHTELLGLADDR